MTFGVPWNVKGIRPQARLTAKEAARRSGLSVGEWLNSVIIESAIEEGVRPRRHRQIDDEDLDADGGAFERRLPLDDDDAALAGVNERLEGLSRQIQNLALRAPPEPDRATARDDENSQRVGHAIERLERRLDQLIAQGSPETERRTAAVDRAIAALDGAEEDTSELGRAVAEISARQRALDAAPAGRPNGAGLSQGLEQQLRQLNSQIEALREDDAISDLRADLLDIRRTLTEAMPRHALTSLESEIRALADRLLESRQAGGDDHALAGLETRIAEVRDAVRALTPAESLVGVDDAVKSLAQKIEFIAAHDQDPGTLHQLEDAISALRRMTSQVASNDALTQLTQQVHEFSAKIDNLATGSDMLAMLEERIGKLADALQRHNSASVPPQFDAVLKSVNDKLERLQLKSGDNADLGAMEERLGTLLERIEAGRHRNPPAADPGIDALKDEIEEIKQSRSESDRRLHETLEALNGTLGNVVDRLALIETDLRNARQTETVTHGSSSRAASVPPMQPVPLMQAVPPMQPVPPSASAQAANYAAAVAKLPPLPPSPPPPKWEPIDPNLPPDHPLEPGSRGRVAIAADRAAGSRAAPPPVIPDPGGKSDFIAAARRAAQAAGGTAPKTTTRAAAGSTDAAPAKGKRSVLVGISAVLILLGALHVGANLLGLYNGTPAAKAPASVRAPAIETEPAAEPAMPPPNRQSGFTPNGIFMPTPSIAVTVREPAAPTRQAVVSKPEHTSSLKAPEAPPAPRQAALPKSEFPGSVQMPVVPAATPEYAALPEAPVLPTAIGGPGLRTAAINGDAAAAYEIATRYAEGRGVPQNYEEAARWLERAANLAPAQFRLGSLYEKGLGVKKDLEIARQLYTAAGEKGNAKAMHNLAVLYAEGIDGKPDYASAAQWFRKSADRGISDSQYNLGILYARGIGVEQNLPESYKWFALAALAGDNDSAKKRDDVGGRLDAQALMAARLAAQSWTADPQPEEATTVKQPAGGWEQTSPRPAKPKPAARPRTSASVGSP